MSITKDDVIKHATTVASAIETLAGVADFKHARPVEVVAAMTRAVLGLLKETFDGEVTVIDVETRLAALREETAAIDDKYDAALAAKFDSSTD